MIYVRLTWSACSQQNRDNDLMITIIEVEELKFWIWSNQWF